MGAEQSQEQVSPPTEQEGKVKDEQVKLKPPPSNHNHTTGAIVIATEVKYPHNHAEILKTADAAVDGSSTEKLYDQLQSGVFLNQHKKKYWVDKNSKNCFMLYAKDLSITWAETSSYWHWTFIKESSDESIVAAELLNVCWLEVHGRFNTANLTPRTRYEVIFVVMLKDPAYGWEVPINFRLILPNGSRQEHKENMMERERGKWIEIPAGEFETLQENAGEMEISLYEYEGGNWKRGLLIKGVVIRPKSQSSA